MAVVDLIPREKEEPGEPPEPSPVRVVGKGSRLRPVTLALLTVAILLFFFGNRFATFYTDWLWFRSVDKEIVFTRVYGTRILLFFLFGATTFLLAHFNIWLTERISPPMAVPTSDQHALYPAKSGKPVGRTIEALSSFRTTLDLLLLGGALILGVATGVTGQAQWDNYLRFLAPIPFGERDPVFGRDIGFFIFTLPFLRYVQAWLVIVFFITGLGTALVYVYQYGINVAFGVAAIGPRVRAHLSALGAFTLLAAAWGYYLDRFYLMFGDGRFPGAGYTDIHSRLPGNYLLMVVTVLVAAAVTVNIWRRSLILPGVAMGLWLVFFVGNILVPYFQQRLRVLPNEATREMPYITRAISATRAAYDLDAIRVEPINSGTSLPPGANNEFADTLKNVRLWESDILLRYLMQRQTDRQYYRFTHISPDRYYLSGKPIHVAVTTREFAPDRLEGNALSWQNLHLRYTHGYGAVVTQLSRVDASGLPELLVKGLPPVAEYPDLEIRQPQIYYGVSKAHEIYAVIKSRVNEFEYPTDADTPSTVASPPASPTTTEKRGIALTPLNRFAFALRLATWSILLSQDVTSESEILQQRHVPLRVKRIAPFLQLERDPYVMIVNGRLLWVVDGYTTASTYPYSAQSDFSDDLSPAGQVNYVRSAVKATVDAYDGSVRLYAVDDDDPILRCYQNIFPRLIQPSSEMPAAVRLHQRYPKGLLEIQRRLLMTYHTQDPSVFYSQADTWSVPRGAAVTRNTGEEREMAPEYTLCRLPGETEAEYTLLSPLTPRNRETMASLLVARCDGERYGERILYQFPNAQLPAGPEQALRRIRADSQVRAFLFEMNQRGSRVLFGEVRTVPVQRVLLYVVPIYTESDAPEGTDDNLGEIRQVAILMGDTIVLQPTLDAAVNELVRQSGKSTGPPDDASQSNAAVTQLSQQAVKQYEAAQSALRAGDFARYGELNRALGVTLDLLKAAVEQGNAPESGSGGGVTTGGSKQ